MQIDRFIEQLIENQDNDQFLTDSIPVLINRIGLSQSNINQIISQTSQDLSELLFNQIVSGYPEFNRYVTCANVTYFYKLISLPLIHQMDLFDEFKNCIDMSLKEVLELHYDRLLYKDTYDRKNIRLVSNLISQMKECNLTETDPEDFLSFDRVFDYFSLKYREKDQIIRYTPFCDGLSCIVRRDDSAIIVSNRDQFIIPLNQYLPELDLINIICNYLK